MNPSKVLGKAPPWLFRRGMNLYPPIRASGVRVTRISEDWKEWDLKLPLTWRTRNYVGTLFGGSLYAAADPHYMLAFLRLLGPEYVVWDKAATIRFRRPGRSTLYGSIRIPDEELTTVRRLCSEHPKVDRTYRFEWKDADGVVHAEIDKVLHFRRTCA